MDGGGWVNILGGWKWVGMSGGEWGWVHCLIMPLFNEPGNRFYNNSVINICPRQLL